MNRDDIIRLWQKATGWSVEGFDNTIADLKRFAALVATAERERCINILKTTYVVDDGEDFVQLVLDRINHD